MKLKFPSSLIFLVLVSNSVNSQGGFVPFSQDYVTDRFEAHTTVILSSEDINAIPLHEVYRTVLLKILGHPALLSQFPKADIEILSSLPDHTDSSFRRPLNTDLRQACLEIENKLDSSHASDLVSIFLEAEQKHEQRLYDHYQSVINSLSSRGIMLINYRIEALSKGNSLAHAETDYVALSSELPDLMKERLISGCADVKNDLSRLQSKLLTANFVHRDDFLQNED